MKSGALWLVLLVAGFTAAVLYMMGVQFAGGDVYPEFSTMRTDPRGARLLYDSLARLGGMSVARNYQPASVLADRDATLVFLGLNADFAGQGDQLKELEQLAMRGNRLVLALAPARRLESAAELYRAWNVALVHDPEPRRLHNLYFREARGWRVVEQIGSKLFVIERSFGRGQIILFSGSEDFTNSTTVVGDRLRQVSAALGDPSRIVFDETHLGIGESGSVVGLARRFRLTGMALGLALCAALFIWRNAAAFPPPAPISIREGFSGRTSRSGLVTLLRRHIPAAGIAAACWDAWLAANRRGVPPHRLEQASAAAATFSSKPLEAMREIHSIIAGRKGAS